MDSEKWNKIPKWVMVLIGALAVCIAFYPQVRLAVSMTLGGVAIAFVLRPLAERLSRHMSDGLAALLSVAIAFLLLAAIALLFVPTMIVQLLDLASHFGEIAQWAQGLVAQLSEKLVSMGLGAIAPGELDLTNVAGDVGGIARDTAQWAGSLVGSVGNVGLSVMLGIYFLLDWDGLMLQAELVVPIKARPIVLRMAGEAARGLRGYLRGQMTVSLMVGALATVGLMAIGVRSALALGVMVGLLNMIPYFGPILGGVPVVLTALTQDVIVALMAISVLFVVQQIDGMFISPRVMSGVTGLPPASVLIALAVGGSGWGILGMLLALPIVLIVRICFRVWATRNEVIEKKTNV